MGGSAPAFLAPARRSSTKRRMSSRGFPTCTCSRACVGPWLTADSEAEAAAGQLVDQGRRLGVVVWVSEVDIRDAGAERDLARGQGEGLAQGKAVADARAVDAREALLLEPLRELHRGLSTPGHRGQAHGRLCRHRHLQGDWHIMGTPEDTR